MASVDTPPPYDAQMQLLTIEYAVPARRQHSAYLGIAFAGALL